MRNWLTPTLVLAVLAAAGCGSSSSSAPATAADTGGNADLGTIDDSDGTDTLVAEAEPETPEECGYKVGNTLCNGDLSGYQRNETTGVSTSGTYETFRLTDALAKGTQKYAMVWSAAYW